jgi:phosphoserine phosphatase
MNDDAAYAALSADTSSDAQKIQIARWREMSPAEKLRLVTQLSQAVDALALAGIRAAYPSASPRECFLRLACRRLGDELALRAYPEIADLPERR